MQARMSNPVTIVTGAAQHVEALWGSAYTSGVSPPTLHLVHPRASQIHGCSSWMDSTPPAAEKAGEPEKRPFTMAAWREEPCFTERNRLNVTTRQPAGSAAWS